MSVIRRSRSRYAIAAMCVLSLVAASCGDDDEDNAEDTATATAETTAAPATTEATAETAET